MDWKLHSVQYFLRDIFIILALYFHTCGTGQNTTVSMGTKGDNSTVVYETMTDRTTAAPLTATPFESTAALAASTVEEPSPTISPVAETSTTQGTSAPVSTEVAFSSSDTNLSPSASGNGATTATSAPENGTIVIVSNGFRSELAYSPTSAPHSPSSATGSSIAPIEKSATSSVGHGVAETSTSFSTAAAQERLTSSSFPSFPGKTRSMFHSKFWVMPVVHV
ncbi:uncharacterized protein LOC102462611 isoform X2 [Pelodiscus sinensis]|uniref:uncharacterized protein LOC102462611 isoform X2 n=1 Tax=Pelodiscus sinensis TaxID=13735 RepID=UPI003F6DA1DA